ncbi:MAG: hypothetical protein EOP09_10595, partial [Proteobacteria bacterium]
ASNDLAPYALWDIDEIKSVGSQAGFDVVIGLDLPNQSEMKIYQVGKSSSPFDPKKTDQDYRNQPLDLDALTAVPMSGVDPLPSKRFSQLLKAAQKFYPSRRTMVIIWGHGFGWSSRARISDSTAGLLTDESSRSSLSILTLKKILLEQTVTPELLISDACLMQSAEVLSEFSSFIPRAIGSSQVHDYQGLPYRRFLNIFSQTLASSRESEVSNRFSKQVPELYRAFQEHSELGSERDSDPLTGSFSSVDLREWRSQLMPAFKRWVEITVSSMARDPLLIPSLKKVRGLSPVYPNKSIELSSFLKLWMNELRTLGYATNTPLYDLTRVTSERLDQSLVDYFSFERTTQARSVSFYFPSSRDDWRARKSDFLKSQFYQETGIAALMDAVYP